MARVILDDVTEDFIRRALRLKETDPIPPWIYPAYNGVKMFWQRMGGGTPNIYMAMMTVITGRLLLRRKRPRREGHAPREPEMRRRVDTSWAKDAVPGMLVNVRIGKHDCKGELLAILDDRRANVRLLRSRRSRVFRLHRITPKERVKCQTEST